MINKKEVVLTFHHCDKIPGQIRFQSTVTRLHCFWMPLCDEAENHGVEHVEHVVEQNCSPHGSQEKGGGKDKVYSPSSYAHDPLPSTRSYYPFPSLSNTVIKLWIHQWISLLVKLESSWPVHLPKASFLMLLHWVEGFQKLSLQGDMVDPNHSILLVGPKSCIHLTIQNAFSHFKREGELYWKFD